MNRKGVRYYVIIDPSEALAKIYFLRDGRYIKLLDAHQDNFLFMLDTCEILFDFSKIWLSI